MVHTYEGEGLNEIRYSVRNDVLTSNYTQYSDNRMGRVDQGAHFTKRTKQHIFAVAQITVTHTVGVT